MKNKSRSEVLNSTGYWVSDIQIKLFAEIEAFMKKNQMNRTQLAAYLGCSKGYVTQLLSGDFDNKLSKLVDLSLAIGKIPQIEFMDASQFIMSDMARYQCVTKETDESSFKSSVNSIKKYPFSIVSAA